MAHVGLKLRPMVPAAISTAFAQETGEAAHAGWRAVAGRLRERFPRLSKPMEEAGHDVLAYMAFPKEHWTQIHSTNPIERLAGALLLEQNDEWAICRRYMTLETLAGLSDDPNVRLTAIAAA